LGGRYAYVAIIRPASARPNTRDLIGNGLDTHLNFEKPWIDVKEPRDRINADHVDWLTDINADPTGLAIVVFPPDLDAVSLLLQDQPVDVYEFDGILRVRLIEQRGA
jgi:hypothetical protein